MTLKGIPPLVSLLSSPSLQVQETVAAALRNVVFKNQANKEEVQRCGGITQAVQLLSNTNSETQKHLTGTHTHTQNMLHTETRLCPHSI